MTAAEKIVRALAAKEPLVGTDMGNVCGLCDSCQLPVSGFLPPLADVIHDPACQYRLACDWVKHHDAPEPSSLSEPRAARLLRSRDGLSKVEEMEQDARYEGGDDESAALR